MRWTVVYVDNSENELADIWLHAADRQAITAAAHRIDEALRDHPDMKGDDFYGDRIYQESPLAVAYTLRPEDRLVRIFQVMRIRG